MKVKEETSRAGMVSRRIFSAGGGKKKTGRKFTAYALTTFMLVNTVFINGMFIVKPTEVAAAGDSGVDLEDGLVGYYSFDGTLENSIGTGSAVLHGGAGDTWNTPATGTAAYAQGKNGKAYSFTGDNGAVKGEGLELDVKMSTAYTISYWVNPDTVTSATSMVFVPIDLDNGLNIADNWFGNSFPTVRIWGTSATTVSEGSYMDNFLTNANDLCGQWTYITLTGDTSGNNVLYINGTQVSTGSSIAGAFTNMDIFLGINFWDKSFDGLMDDVVVYNKALSASEVMALYNKNGVPMSGASSIVTPAHVSVHDPSIIKEGDTYYIFGSHLAWAKTKDLIHWETFENNINKDFKTLFAKEAEWAAMGDSTYVVDGNMWAPDVIWNETLNKWCMYMSINGCSWNSCICLLTADHLDGDWEYVGPIIYSGFTDSKSSHNFSKTDYTKVTGDTTIPARYTMTAYTCTGNDGKTKTESTTWNRRYGAHAIDPCIITDSAGDWYMAYGSWSGGIYMIKLDKTTGLRDYTTKYNYVENEQDPYMGYHLAGGNGVSGEASYIQKVEDYYYLYVTLGGLVADGGYNMRVFRSKNLTGPYVDYSGDDARTQTANYNSSVGNRVMSGYQWSYMQTGYVAQGHNSAFVDDDGKAYVIYHTRFNDGTEGHQVRVHQMFVNEEGWLVTAPFEYTGETLSTNVTKEDVAGAYEVLFHRLNIDYGNLEVVTGENLTFNADGTITGDRTGTWEFSSKGTPYVTMKIGNYTYKGVFLKQQMEDATDTTWTFTVLGNDEISVWGYKYVGDGEELATKAAENLVMPQGTFVNLELPAKGINNSTITWKSSNEAVLTSDGKITIPTADTKVTLTGTFTVQGVSVEKDYPITVYSPQTDKENKVLATYFTGEKKDLTNAVKGTYQYANPFYDGTTKGLEMYNGVSIKFDVKPTAGADQWLTDIIGFNSGSTGGLYFEGNSYLGFNHGPGKIFDANVVNGTNWAWGTDFINTSASVEIKILPTGFEVYINDILAYNQADIGNKVPGSTDMTSWASILDFLQNAATYLNFGWGSWWEGGYKGTISDVVLSVLPVEVVDTTGYLYYENYNKLAGKTGNATGWISTVPGSLSVKTDELHKGYFNFAVGNDAGNRGAYTLFNEKAQASGEYVIELDTSLTAGVLTQRSVSEFAILGTDAKNYTGNDDIASGYILKLKNEPPTGSAANQSDYSNQTKWYINDSTETVTIPVGTWVHIKVSVDTETGTAVLTITNNTTNKVIYTGNVEMNGTGTLAGLYLLRGRGVGTASVDNIAVHIHDWDEGEITKEPGCTTAGEKTYTCSVCGETKTEEVEATGHTYNSASYNSNKITISCEKGDSSKIITLDVVGGSISNFSVGFDKETMTVTLPESSMVSREGYELEGWKDSAGKEYQAEFDVSAMTSNITLTAIWKDIEPPTGTISVADRKWQTFIEKITFGIYKATQEVVTIEAEDNEEMGTIYYLIATEGTTYTLEEVQKLSADVWTEYQDSKKPVLQKDTQNVIYVKLVDKAGNTNYISSDGIVEDETAPEITMETIAGSILDVSARIQISSNEAGTYYFLFKEGGADTALNVDKLIETVGEGKAIEADQKITLDQTGLQPNTSYTAYLAVVDKAGNKSQCKILSFKTVNEVIEITNTNISGEKLYHSELAVSAENAKDMEMSYQWYRSENEITEDTDVSSLEKISCTSEKYTLQKEDVGNYIAVVISIADESYGGFALAYTDSAVMPIEITASVKIADKVYDGTNVAEISNITLDGIIAGDDVTANAQAVFADANAAQDKVVTVSNITLSGEDAAAYKLTNTQIETTASISKRPLKITEFTIADKVYDKTTSAEIATLEFEGVVEGEEIFYEATVEFSDANAGVDKTVSGTVKLIGSSTTNYMLEGSDSEGVVEITGKAEIQKAQPEYTIPQNITAVYGSTLRDITLPEGFAFDIEALENGLDTEVGDAGTQELPAVYTPEDTTNYVSVNVLISVTVTKAAKEAPELTVVDETIYGKADGILNGLTTEMEYSTDGTKYISVEDDAMTFAAGTYSVRYKEDNNYFASPAVQVVIKEGRMLKVVFLIDGEEIVVRETGWNGEITDIPEIPEKTGYDQTPPRWDVAEFKNIQNDMTVHAVYTINTYAVNLTQGEGYTLQIADSEETAGKVDYLGSCSFKLTVADGYSRTDSFAVKANGVVLTADENGTYSLTDISKDYTITVEGIADLTAPTGEIKVRENIWNTSFAPTAWNLFFNASQTVTITAEDKGSGISEISYYLADTPLTADNVNWTVYKEPFALMPNNEYIVYARIVDKAGNYTYINSEGMIFDDIIPAVMVQNNNGFTVISDGAEYERAQTFKVTDAYLDKVFVNNKQISLSEQGIFVLEPSNDKYVITAKDKAGNQASYIISVNKAKGAGNVVMEGWTYGEAAKEPQITDINNTGYTVKYYKGSEELDAAPVNAGDYTVKVIFNETDVYAEYVVFVDYTIARIEVAAPTSIEKTDETVSGKKDGTITGLTAEMEYSRDGVNYIDVSGNADAQGIITLTGLEPGTYYVRYKTDENHNALVTIVTIQAGIVENTSSGIPQIKGEDGKLGWEVISNEITQIIEQNLPKKEVDVQMNGSTELPKDIILQIKGKDIVLRLDMGAGILWTIDGKTVTGDSFRDISMEVILDTDNIPKDILTGVTSGKTFKNLTLVHEGEFGFTPVLTINVGRENSSLLAKLYYYNKATGQMELSDSEIVDADGNAKFTFTHASEYTIIIDASDGTGEGNTTNNGKFPATGDLQQDTWNRTWFMMIASLMVIAGVGSLSMKKRRK